MMRLTAVKQLAHAVGLTVKVVKDPAGDFYQLLDGVGEPLCMEYDTHDMEDSIQVYAGSHPGFDAAIDEFRLSIGGVE